MRRSARKIVRRVRPVTLGVAFLSASLALSTASASAQSESVELARDGHGVAHVAGTSDAGAFYGAGYAHAEDRLFQMCLHRVIAQGRIAEFFGPDMNTGDGLYVDHDVYTTVVGWERGVALEWAAMPAPEAALLQAFADGVTAYMTEVRNATKPEHPLFAATGIPLDEDWTPQDSLLLWVRFASKFSNIDWSEPAKRFKVDAALAGGMTEAQYIDANFNGLCDDDSAVVQESDVDPMLIASMAAYATAKGLDTSTNCAGGLVPPPPHFSHAWAVHADRVVEGGSALVSDPRLGLTIPNTLYEWQMRGETFDVRGAGLPGVPYVLIGSNDDVAWGATALGPDQADLFKMEVDTSVNPPTYTLDMDDGMGPQQVPMLQRTVEIKIAGQASQLVKYRETFFGPLVTQYVQLAAGQTLAANEQYALKRLPMSHPDQSSFHGFLATYRAGDVDEFRDALGGILFPAYNSVFADSAGSIGYQANGGFPVRASQFLAGYQALDGTTVLNDWQELLPNDFKPWVIDPEAGAVWSANHQPIGSFYPLPFVSGALGTGARAWRLEQLLDTGSMMTIRQIYDVHLSSTRPDSAALAEVAEAIAMVDGSFPYSTEAAAALPHLSAWRASGAEMTNAHPATFLAGIVSDRFPNIPGQGQSPLAAVYGGRGMIPLLEVLLAKMDDPMGFAPTTDEKNAIDDFLHKAWLDIQVAPGPGTKGGAGSTDPMVWQPLYQATRLDDVYTASPGLGEAPWTVTDSIPKLTGAPGLANIAITVAADASNTPFPHDPAYATAGGSIMEQAGQSFTQFVRPGYENFSLSVLTPGVREWWLDDPMAPVPVDVSGHAQTGGLGIDRNQEPLWSGLTDPMIDVDLKWSPTTALGITNLTGGFLSAVTLTYTP